MTKVLTFIENDMYIRNFVTSGSFDNILDNASSGIYVSEAVEKLRNKIPQGKLLGSYKRNIFNSSLIYEFNTLSMRALRKKSETFNIKTKVNLYKSKFSLFYLFLSWPILFSITKSIFRMLIQKNKTLENVIIKEKPRLVIFPITGVEATGYELVKLSKKYNFKTFFIVNGWDNLSSKGIFPLLPDYLGVWGPQALEDAIQIQGMQKHQVYLLGSARYESYFVSSEERVNPFPFKYILFAGATVANDEITPLKKIDQLISKAGINDLKIIYRPHPWREKRNCFDLFRKEDYKNIILDPQIEAKYYNAKNEKKESVSANNYPELEYYKGLLENAMFVISPMSSMTLEAALFNVPTLILAYDDGYHKVPTNLQAKYRHFEGGETIPGWYYVRKLETLVDEFNKIYQLYKADTRDKRTLEPILRDSMQKYIILDSRSYAQRLSEAVENILVKN